MWTGYSQSLLAGDGCLSLNIDMSCTAFLEQSAVISYLAKAANIPDKMISEMNKAQHRKATKAIVGLKARHPVPTACHLAKAELRRHMGRQAAASWPTELALALQVEVIHMGNQRRNYKVKDLSSEGASELIFFNNEINEEQSVAAYFEQRYRK